MKLNNLELISYVEHTTDVDFVIEATFAEVNKLDGKKLTVTSGDEPSAIFGGYNLASMAKTSESYTRARFVKALDPDTAQAIEALQETAKLQAERIGEHGETQSDIQAQVDELAEGLMEIATIIAEGAAE